MDFLNTYVNPPLKVRKGRVDVDELVWDAGEIVEVEAISEQSPATGSTNP